ncbi:MAG: iron-containing alcohol dehydrogenase [Chloroflexota bacterium]|nr:iron-containing alcohol dehydrogenase [Chloroflexota bacterium]
MGSLADLTLQPARYLVVHSGAASVTGYGARFISEGRRTGLDIEEFVVSGNSDASVEAVTQVIEEVRPGVVAGVGGGRLVDVAKMAAAERNVDFVSVPTQASSDGICSPVAVIHSADGRPRSLGARIPIGVVVDMDELRSAPVKTWRSGLGDLVSNLSAVRDWRMAHEVHGEPIDDFACLTAEAAAGSVIRNDADLTDRGFQERLIRGLILSGIAMEMSGSSRPASGSEHLISHALDSILDIPRHHGLQVALATVAAFVLRDEPCDDLVKFFRATGLPVLPQDLDISTDDFIEAVRHGRRTRPGRWTVLDVVGEPEFRRLRSLYDRGGLGLWA